MYAYVNKWLCILFTTQILVYYVYASLHFYFILFIDLSISVYIDTTVVCSCAITYLISPYGWTHRDIFWRWP